MDRELESKIRKIVGNAAVRLSTGTVSELILGNGNLENKVVVIDSNTAKTVIAIAIGDVIKKGDKVNLIQNAKLNYCWKVSELQLSTFIKETIVNIKKKQSEAPQKKGTIFIHYEDSNEQTDCIFTKYIQEGNQCKKVCSNTLNPRDFENEYVTANECRQAAENVIQESRKGFVAVTAQRWEIYCYGQETLYRLNERIIAVDVFAGQNTLEEGYLERYGSTSDPAFRALFLQYIGVPFLTITKVSGPSNNIIEEITGVPSVFVRGGLYAREFSSRAPRPYLALESEGAEFLGSFDSQYAIPLNQLEQADILTPLNVAASAGFVAPFNLALTTVTVNPFTGTPVPTNQISCSDVFPEQAYYAGNTTFASPFDPPLYGLDSSRAFGYGRIGNTDIYILYVYASSSIPVFDNEVPPSNTVAICQNPNFNPLPDFEEKDERSFQTRKLYYTTTPNFKPKLIKQYNFDDLTLFKTNLYCFPNNNNFDIYYRLDNNINGNDRFVDYNYFKISDRGKLLKTISLSVSAPVPSPNKIKMRRSHWLYRFFDLGLLSDSSSYFVGDFLNNLCLLSHATETLINPPGLNLTFDATLPDSGFLAYNAPLGISEDGQFKLNLRDSNQILYSESQIGKIAETVTIEFSLNLGNTTSCFLNTESEFIRKKLKIKIKPFISSNATRAGLFLIANF